MKPTTLVWISAGLGLASVLTSLWAVHQARRTRGTPWP